MNKVNLIWNSKMIKKTLLVLVGLSFTLFSGCNESEITSSNGENYFPEFLVGTWKANNADWQFTFDADGEITHMKHNFIKISDEIDISTGEVYEQLKGDYFSIYTLGACTAQYDSETRQLNVSIKIENFHMELPVGIGEGNMTDRINGIVHQDNQTWTADWYSDTEFIDQGKTDPSSKPVKQLMFIKID